MLLCSPSDAVKAGDQYTAVYIIHGLLLGRTDIVATAVQHGKKNPVTSDAREIQVCSHVLHFSACYVFLRLILVDAYNTYRVFQPSCISGQFKCDLSGDLHSSSPVAV